MNDKLSDAGKRCNEALFNSFNKIVDASLDVAIQFRKDMIDYIQAKIDEYQKMDNMHQIVDILRALICDIKIDIKRLEEEAWKKENSSK